jgi:protein TIF31
MLSDLASLEVTVIETVSLTRTLHERGVNMRYLGQVANLCTEHTEFIRRLLIQEMIARACKHALRQIIEAAFQKDEGTVPVVVASYLNALFGVPDLNATAASPVEEAPAGGKKKKKNKKKQPKEDPEMPTTQAAPIDEDVHGSVSQKVKELYNYDLPSSSTQDWWQMFSQTSLLRAICLKVGMRIKSREYAFDGPCPFESEDICDFFPIVNHVMPKCKAPQGAMETGMMSLQMGHFEMAFNNLNNALGMYHQIMGPMNKEVATCFSYIGNIMYYAGDIEQALLHHHKALLISRRVLGYDNSLTSHVHQHMGLICHTLGRNDIALEHFKRAYYLMRLSAGFNHPEACISLANVGMMYQETGDHARAVKCLKQALQHSEKMLGHNHPHFNQQFIACCYALSISLSQLADFKEAVVYQKKVYEAQRAISGGNDAATADAEKWLTTLVTLAVDAQRKTVALAPKPASGSLLWPKGKRLP